jgi:mevalonate pyrophosphate decarboxylase
MKLVLDIPDEISAQLSLRLEDPAHAALEALAAASYSQGILSMEQVRCLLRLGSGWEAKAVLTKLGAWPAMSGKDLDEDLQVLEMLQTRL